MKVKHELIITAQCPVDESSDEYECIVETECLIKVEDILRVCQSLSGKKIFQEQLCCEIAKGIGGDSYVTLIGTHSSVKTTVSCYSYE